MLIMAGLIFTLIGGALAYVTFWVVSERLVDDRLGREGTPWPIILIISFTCLSCLIVGISSIIGKKWLLRLMMLVGTGLDVRSGKSAG
jgi:protein-S-isoprenylcysteine O-methyltransferase Ste14